MEGLKEGLHILAGWDLRELLAHLKCQVCYLFGRFDTIVPGAIKNIMQNRYPHFNYVTMKRAAHAPFLTDKEVFIAELKRFLL